MPVTVDIDEDLKLIRITPRGEVTKEDLQRGRSAVFDMLRDGPFKKVLVNASLADAMPPTTILFEHIVEVSRADIPLGIKFAVVTAEQTRSDSRFMETTARNRGVMMKDFESEDEALAWLRIN